MWFASDSKVPDDDLIDHCFRVLGAFPNRQLSVRAGAFTHNPLDVRDLALVAEFVDFSRNKLEHFMQQFALLHFTFTAEID